MEKYVEIPLGKARDLSQQKFGYLTPLYRTENASGKTAWVCQCDCGEIMVATADHLLRGHTQSCGCLQRQRTSEANSLKIQYEKFGKLTPISKIEPPRRSNGDRCIYWLCECDCGNLTITQATYLKSGHTQSCGCIKSIGEMNIADILRKNNILFVREYSFNDLLGKDNHPYRFDFFLPDYNRLIEFDGEQHYQNSSWSKLEEVKIRDENKNKYALSNNIDLVRIPYWQRNNITIDMLLGDKYLVKE